MVYVVSALPLVLGVGDRRGHRAAGQDSFLLGVEPRLDASSTGTLRSWRSANRVAASASFASRSIGVQLGDQRKHLRGALFVRILRIVELPRACAQQATSVTPLRMIDPVVTAVGVGLQVTSEVLQATSPGRRDSGSACSRTRCTGWPRRPGSTRCAPCGIASGRATESARSCRRCESLAIGGRAQSSDRPAARPSLRHTASRRTSCCGRYEPSAARRSVPAGKAAGGRPVT